LKQHIVRIILGLAVVAAFIGHVVELYRVPFLDQLDNIIYDARLRWAAPKTTHEKIVILDIDEKSLGQLGRWPWERDKLATLIDKLFAKYGMVVVGFDVVFAEKDTSSGLPVLERLAKDRFKDNDQLQQAMPELRKQLDYDGRFAAALKGKPVVMGYYFSSEDNAQKTGALSSLEK
jgi:adenylate cyclase